MIIIGRGENGPHILGTGWISTCLKQDRKIKMNSYRRNSFQARGAISEIQVFEIKLLLKLFENKFREKVNLIFRRHYNI